MNIRSNPAARARRARFLALALPAALLVSPALATTPVPVNAVPTIADMVGLGASSSTYPYLVVTGAQGGVFLWNASGAAATDSCTTFAATGVSTGRWERQNYAGQDSIPLSWCDTLVHADAAAVAQSKSLYVDQAVTLATNTTLTARRVLGQEKIALGGFTLSIGGFYDPAPYQVFNAADAASITFRKPPMVWTGENFGAIGDGTTDDYAADNAAMLVLAKQHGGNFTWRPNRVYKHSGGNVTLDMTYGLCDTNTHFACTPQITGYGASVTTGGSVDALDVKAGDQAASSTIEGVTFNMDANATAGTALRGIGTTHPLWMNNTVLCNANDVAFDLGNSTPSDGNTGTFWATLAFNRIATANDTSCSVGINSHGDTNATNLIYNALNNSTAAITIAHDTGQTLMPNGFNVEGNDFETDTYDVDVLGAPGASQVTGLAVVNNQVDDGSNNAGAFLFYGSSTGVSPTEPDLVPVVWMNRDEGGGPIANPFSLRLNTCSPMWNAGTPKCTIYSHDGGSFQSANGYYDMPSLPGTNPGAGHGWYYDSTTHAVTEGH